MSRGNGPGRKFDDQYHHSRRMGQNKPDKYITRVNNEMQGGKHRGDPKGCADKTAALVLFLGGLGWGISEVAGKVL